MYLTHIVLAKPIMRQQSPDTEFLQKKMRK